MGDLHICICTGELHFSKDSKGITMLTYGMLPPPFPPTRAEVKHFWLFIYSLPFKSYWILNGTELSAQDFTDK